MKTTKAEKALEVLVFLAGCALGGFGGLVLGVVAVGFFFFAIGEANEFPWGIIAGPVAILTGLLGCCISGSIIARHQERREKQRREAYGFPVVQGQGVKQQISQRESAPTLTPALSRREREAVTR